MGCGCVERGLSGWVSGLRILAAGDRVMGRVAEHAQHIETLADEAWRALYRLQESTNPGDLIPHENTLKMTEAILGRLLEVIKQKKAA